MDIVRLSPSEGRRLRPLRLRALRDAPDAFGTIHGDAAALPDAAWQQQLETLATFVAVVDGLDVGMVRGVRSDDDPRAAYLLSMWVAPAHRRTGIGMALVRRLIDWARDEAFDRVILDVGDHNEPAVRFYDCLGFVRNGVVGHLPEPRAHLTEHQRVFTLSD